MDPALQVSTAISDVPVALSAAYAAWSLRKVFPFGSLAYSVVTIAASLGVIRFGFDTSFIPAHEFFSEFAGQVLLSAMYLSFVNIPKNVKSGTRRSGSLPFGAGFSWLVCAVLLALFVVFRYVVPSKAYGEIVPAVCFLPVMYVAFTRFEPFTIAGVVLYMAMGAVVTDLKGVNPHLGIPNLDVFHCLLTLAQLAFAHALLRLLR
eukprot:TRINITY_DN18689_c0_g1_i1.p1 TRINITY_DN18689_c0_g1~~TRINITY_DN18689_c0_g1_i1.p1  ORF type:complete len:222 (+),score=21.40 TRINITY_DN18689_c0_g1_i1:54-668(+)